MTELGFSRLELKDHPAAFVSFSHCQSSVAVQGVVSVGGKKIKLAYAHLTYTENVIYEKIRFNALAYAVKRQRLSSGY